MTMAICVTSNKQRAHVIMELTEKGAEAIGLKPAATSPATASDDTAKYFLIFGHIQLEQILKKLFF